MRALVLSAMVLAAAGAATADTGLPLDAVYRPSDGVIAGDACGASRFAHLVGEPFATMHHASLPARTRVVANVAMTTLEYRPERLNLVLDASATITAVGCF